MDKSQLNRMNKDLQEWKLNVENAQANATAENAGAIERLKTQIENMENTFMELRGAENPANKIYQWFKNHFATKPEYSCFDIKATDSAFKLIVCGEKAFNLNLRHEVEARWRMQNDADWRTFRQICTPGVMFNEHNGWFQKEAFTPFIFPESVNNNSRKMEVEFKFSRKVFKHPDEMNEFLSAFVEHVYNCCKRHQKQ